MKIEEYVNAHYRYVFGYGHTNGDTPHPVPNCEVKPVRPD